MAVKERVLIGRSSLQVRNGVAGGGGKGSTPTGERLGWALKHLAGTQSEDRVFWP